VSKESVFNKKLAPETTMEKVEGLLEHFNLPPKVITFIRKHQRRIQVFLGIVIVCIVAWSFYGSYLDKVTEEGATALSGALRKQGDEKMTALQKVVEDYGTTSSALWAKVELAHHDMEAGEFAAAAKKYEEILPEIDADNPIYPLILFGGAQAHESNNSFQQSNRLYDLLKAITGFEYLGYTGLARIEEAQGNIEKAISIYNNFLLDVGDDQSYAETKADIDNKIARLKALM